LSSVAVELEGDVRQAGATGKGHLLAAWHQISARERHSLAVQLARCRHPLAARVLLHEFQLGGLADEPLGFLGVLETGQLDDDAVRAKRLDFRLGHAVGVHAALDHVQHALHGGGLLVGWHVGQVGLERQLCAALEVESEFGALADERAQVDAWVARQRVSAGQIATRPLRPDDDDGEHRQDEDEE
jgi:hypothetical protein